MLVVLAGHAGGATTLGQRDIDTLHSDIQTMTEAFERGDAEPMIQRTHPSLKAMVGGDEAFAEMTRNAVVQLGAMGLTFVSQEIGAPTRVYPAGKEEVCFVPRISVMALQDRQMKSIGYMVAIRPKGAARGPTSTVPVSGRAPNCCTGCCRTSSATFRCPPIRWNSGPSSSA